VRHELGNELMICKRKSGVCEEARDESAQTHAPAPAVFVNAKQDSVAHGCACSVEHIAQHAARVLAAGSASAQQPARASDDVERWLLHDSIIGCHVKERRKEKRGGGSIDVG
jgi:hypothetical protein